MIIDDYKQLIFDLIEKSEDIDYVIAVYSFADSYLIKVRMKKLIIVRYIKII
ncbi:MAG: hypothetical protein ACLUN9_24305 [Enterocloster aldenensis]